MSTHEKIEENIYYDERCTKYPYYINIMRRGHSRYKKFKTLEDAQNDKSSFIEKHLTEPTEHDLVFKRNGVYVIEATIEKIYIDYGEAVRKAEIIRRFIDS